jgi:alpha-galactosidase/6-phospho-beta-glucosidase family protein
LQQEFLGVGGFSASNLWRMKGFFETYRGVEKLAPLVRIFRQIDVDVVLEAM